MKAHILIVIYFTLLVAACIGQTSEISKKPSLSRMVADSLAYAREIPLEDSSKRMRPGVTMLRLICNIQPEGIYFITCELNEKSGSIQWTKVRLAVDSAEQIFPAPKETIRSKSMALNAAQIRTVNTLLRGSDFLQLPHSITTPPIHDGTGIVMEFAQKDKYHIINRTNVFLEKPSEDGFKDVNPREVNVGGLIMYMIALSEVDASIF